MNGKLLTFFVTNLASLIFVFFTGHKLPVFSFFFRFSFYMFFSGVEQKTSVIISIVLFCVREFEIGVDLESMSQFLCIFFFLTGGRLAEDPGYGDR